MLRQKYCLYDIIYAQQGDILAIYDGLRMRTTFYSVPQTPVLLSIKYSSKSELDETWRRDWPGPAQVHSMIAKHKRYFLQIVDYFTVLRWILMIGVLDSSAFIAIILF